MFASQKIVYKTEFFPTLYEKCMLKYSASTRTNPEKIPELSEKTSIQLACSEIDLRIAAMPLCMP
jgi:hypothetical protein